jgi:hypothetical protein
MLYLDCFHYGAMLGDKFPVNTYGPATREQLEGLRGRVAHNFNRTEVVQKTLGQNPLPPDLWPGVSRPK